MVSPRTPSGRALLGIGKKEIDIIVDMSSKTWPTYIDEDDVEVRDATERDA
jgi:hypothetical protein